MALIDYLQVSRVCNQKCLFCSNPENGRVISWEDAAAQLDGFKAKGARGVIITGGEPTLFPELPRLVAYAKELGLSPRLITNGQRTARRDYLEALAAAGLEHLHVSIHSHRDEVQAELTGNPQSLENLRKTLDHAGALKLRVDVNTVINALNADHLSGIVRWAAGGWPFLTHFVWNNLDPMMNRASLNPRLVPKLRAFEAELALAMRWLDSTGRTFRVERVPLCYMAEFAHRSTETRKIAKDEKRRIFFLDAKGLRHQDRESWSYPKSERCKVCRLEPLCAGLYQSGVYYSPEELCPRFDDPQAVLRRVMEGA